MLLLKIVITFLILFCWSISWYQKHKIYIDKPSTQHYCCVMALRMQECKGAPWFVLPPGIHPTNLAEFAETFAINPIRRNQFKGLLKAISMLKSAGCEKVYIDGSYVTTKPEPGDFDACWDHKGVDPKKLDPVFLDFSNGRKKQKEAFLGEFFPSAIKADKLGTAFIDFFQIEKHTGTKKGIVVIDLKNEDIKSLMEEWNDT